MGKRDYPESRVRDELEWGKLEARDQVRESSLSKRLKMQSRHLLLLGDDVPKISPKLFYS